MPGTNVLVLVGFALYLAASLLLWRLLLKEPPPMASRRNRPRWPRRLAKAFATLIGGTAAGAASLLVVATVVNAGKPGTLTTPAMLAVWAVASVIAMLFSPAPELLLHGGEPGRIGEQVRRAERHELGAREQLRPRGRRRRGGRELARVDRGPLRMQAAIRARWSPEGPRL